MRSSAPYLLCFQSLGIFWQVVIVDEHAAGIEIDASGKGKAAS
jgi:hypothetical protein